MSLNLGIDLGTSNSVIAGLADGKMRIFRPADGGDTLPSQIYIDKRGNKLFGRRAHDQAFIAPENVLSGFKRLMGTTTKLEIPGGPSLSPEEASSEIIKQLIAQVTTELGDDIKIDGTVITIPAAFNQMQSEATLRAAELAGLQNVALLQEPIAAALAAMAGTPRDGYFLIYDLGGGTFDLALAFAKDGEVSIKSHQGINMLGGRDFDRLIVNDIVRPWIAKTFDLPDDFSRSKDFKRLMRIAQLAAERAKIDLSQVEETQVIASEDEVRLQDRAGRDIYLDATITRSDFEKLIREPVDNTISLIRTMLADADIAIEDLNSIVFVGGPSRIPLIREMISETLDVPVDLRIDPLTAVALGAAYHAEGLEWNTQAGAPKAATRKKKEERVEVDKKQTGLDLAFDYSARTSSDKAQIRVVLRAKPAKARWLRVVNTEEEWQSPLYKLEDGLNLSLPLPNVGENRFSVAVFDEQRDPLPHGTRDVIVTRTAASAAQIPAAQTVAVKLLDRKSSPGGGDNVLEPLVEKGTTLPTEGKAVFRAARDLHAGSDNSLALELFQLEYPEKVELNLCIGVFYITGTDLPATYVIRKGEPITFNWNMDESGILRATVLLPAHENEEGGADGIELVTPRFYSPQAGAVAYDFEHGLPFCKAMLAQAENDWGDLAAAIGPAAGPDIQLLNDRIMDQRDIVASAGADPEVIRQVSEEARFLRQDIARQGRRYLSALLQRRLGRLKALFNRIARSHANGDELEQFDQTVADIQHTLDEHDGEMKPEAASALTHAERKVEDLTDHFFELAWRDRPFVQMWFARLKSESYLFPDAAEFESMLEAGSMAEKSGDDEGLRNLVKRMFDIRVRLAASDSVSDPATLLKGE